jgi:hypothetical protein
MSSTEREIMIRKEVNDLFNSANIDRTYFLIRKKQTIPKTLEHFVAPMRLSKEELAMESGLAEIATFDINIHSIESIQQFPLSFESDLILKPPKIVDYHHVVQTSKIAAPIVKPVVKGVREKKTRVSRVMKRSFQVNILPEFAASVEDSHTSKKFRGGEVDEDIDELVGVEELHAPPENLYQVIGNLFNEFWNMEYDETIVNAFLARIDKRNCADYGLTDFASESCSLPVIKVHHFFHSFCSSAVSSSLFIAEKFLSYRYMSFNTF